MSDPTRSHGTRSHGTRSGGSPGPGVPAGPRTIADLYFLEHRAKVLDVAAFLDRYERACEAAGEDPAEADHRVAALRRAVAVLTEPGRGRARRVLEALSDATEAPLDAAPAKGATGAPEPGTASWDVRGEGG